MTTEESVIAHLKHHIGLHEQNLNNTMVGYALYYMKDGFKCKYECLPTKNYNKKMKKEQKGYIDIWTPGWGFHDDKEFHESFNGMSYKQQGVGI